MELDLNLLRLFRAVAEGHNFREAGDRLGVTRSAVSQASAGWKTAWAWPWCSAPRAACASPKPASGCTARSRSH